MVQAAVAAVVAGLVFAGSALAQSGLVVEEFGLTTRELVQKIEQT